MAEAKKGNDKKWNFPEDALEWEKLPSMVKRNRMLLYKYITTGELPVKDE